MPPDGDAGSEARPDELGASPDGGGPSGFSDGSADGSLVAQDSASPYVFVSDPSSPTFSDTFDRADGPIGNGWIERDTSAYALSGGTVKTLTGGSPLRVVRRADTARDVELSVLVDYSSEIDTPSLFARMTYDDVATTFATYRAWIGPSEIVIDLATSSGSGNLIVGDLSPSLVVGARYRFAFRVSGTDPVLLEAGLFTEGGQLLGSARTVHDRASRIVTPGWFGFASKEPGVLYDDFRVWF
jgi:hypothetical protein